MVMTGTLHPFRYEKDKWLFFVFFKVQQYCQSCEKGKKNHLVFLFFVPLDLSHCLLLKPLSPCASSTLCSNYPAQVEDRPATPGETRLLPTTGPSGNVAQVVPMKSSFQFLFQLWLTTEHSGKLAWGSTQGAKFWEGNDERSIGSSICKQWHGSKEPEQVPVCSSDI